MQELAQIARINQLLNVFHLLLFLGSSSCMHIMLRCITYTSRVEVGAIRVAGLARHGVLAGILSERERERERGSRLDSGIQGKRMVSFSVLVSDPAACPKIPLRGTIQPRGHKQPRLKVSLPST